MQAVIELLKTVQFIPELHPVLLWHPSPQNFSHSRHFGIILQNRLPKLVSALQDS
jgi:hypothetical protein